MTPGSRCAAAAALAVLLLLSTAHAEPRRIDNPAKPAGGARTVQAREAWRWGGDEENDPLLGRVADAEFGPDGNAYVLDSNLSVVHVLSPEGELLRTIGGEGDGPGEFRNSGELAFLPSGDLGILEMMPGRVVVISPTGEPRTSFRPAGTEGSMLAMPQHLEADADGIVLGLFYGTFGDGAMTTTLRLGRYAADGSLLASYREVSEQQDGHSLSFSSGQDGSEFISHWTLLPDGRVVVYADPASYTLEILDRDGAPQAEITRAYERLHYSDEEMDEQREQREAMRATYGIESDYELEEWHRDIHSVHARPDGSLWVATGRGRAARPEGSLGVFDVIDADGAFTHTLRVAGVDYDPDRDDYVLQGDRLLIFKESRMASPKMTTAGGGGSTMMMISGVNAPDDDDGEFRPMEVVCYRLDDDS